MPQIFHQSNQSSSEDIERDNAAIESIAEYLVKNSEPAKLLKPPVEGSAERGEKWVKELGCLGCHTAAGASASNFGPELSNLGSKVSPEWLFTWLKNPKHLSTGTRMPNLRLTDEQAADITAYLLSQKNDKFEKTEIPKSRPEVLDEMILTHLQGSMRHEEAKTELAKMSRPEKLQFLGKKSIAHQGCYSCHAIQGFETTKPIGAELSDEGRKDVHLFDFGFVHDIDHTRQGWVARKLKDPRAFDQGKVKSYYEKLRMPQFHFTDDEIDALTTFVLSLNQEQIPLQSQKRLDLNAIQIEKGRLLVSKLNCNGCHTLDGKVGGLRKLAEDEGNPGAAPPILNGEGAKVQEKWLHEFLKNPTTIRPWLTYKMPTFDFSDEELTTLVHTFAGLSGGEVSYKGVEQPQSSPEKLAAGKELFGKLQCVKCHQINAETTAMGTSFLAPDLTLTKKRLKPEWVHKWLTDPQTIDPGTMMPTFFPEGQTAIPDILGGSAEEQIQAVRDYLYRYETTPQDGQDDNNIAK